MVRHGIEIATDGKTMKSLDEGVVQDEHDSSKPPRPSLVPEEHLTNVTHVPNLWMSQAEFPDDQGCVEHKKGLNDGQDKTWDET